MALFNVYPLYDVTPVQGKDIFVYDENETKYLDLYGGHAVISIGHSHPTYVEAISKQVAQIGFYSNAVQNPLQKKLATKLVQQSQCDNYHLFLCNSGAEANENALKLASFHSGKKRVIAFQNSFHGRTSAAVATSDNKNINAPINQQHDVTFLPFNQEEKLENELKKGDICAIIFEPIQGVGGLEQPSESFVKSLETLANKYQCLLIADEVQSGFGRTGNFFAFQKYAIQPHIISIAKGMGNGFPIGGILIHPSIEAKFGLLGTTFGGNHLACAACLSVLEVLENENLLENATKMNQYFQEKSNEIKQIKHIKGQGLMLGLEFDFEISTLRKKLIEKEHIFTGGSSNKKLLRILPPLTIQKEHIDVFFNALKKHLTT